MIHQDQIQSLDKSNHGCKGRKRGKKQKLKKKGPMEVERNVKNPIASRGGVLGCRGFHSSFRTTQGPTRTRIFNSDSAQSLQSSIWFMHGNHIQTVYRNHPSFSNPLSPTPDNAQPTFSLKDQGLPMAQRNPPPSKPFIETSCLKGSQATIANANPKS